MIILLLLLFIGLYCYKTQVRVASIFLKLVLGLIRKFTIIKFRTMQPADNQKQGLKYNSSGQIFSKNTGSSKVDELHSYQTFYVVRCHSLGLDQSSSLF